ncbi:hypothetical protein [Halostagnicola kamekurae]|uniref:hypothetical protein n=1 Tax=Halostagnicola kamekurae TaxID=619731 RepID=UPI000B835D99|nr:hypothetical protein [Halostagnicola kamekurae]
MAVVQDLDLEQFGNQKGVPRVILGVVAVVIDERIRDCKTLDEMVAWSDEFKSTCESHEVSMSDLSTIKSKVREALDEGDVRIPQGKKKIRRDPALPGPTHPDKRPTHYWEEQPAEYWESMAKRWEHLPTERKEAVPDKYQTRIEQLQKWEPWKDEENDDQEDAQRRGCKSDAKDEDRPSMEELEKEAEKALNEIDDESDHEFTE